MKSVIEKMKKLNIEDAMVGLFIKASGDYIMIPYSDNRIDFYLGWTQLDYYEEGNYNNVDKEVFENQLINCLIVSADNEKYEQEEANPKFIKSFLKEGSLCNFKDFHDISIYIKKKENHIKTLYGYPIDKKGREWSAKSEDTKILDINSSIEDVVATIDSYITTQKR